MMIYLYTNKISEICLTNNTLKVMNTNLKIYYFLADKYFCNI